MLLILVLAAVAQGTLWAIVTPPLNGPDEEAHAAYAAYLAATGHRPSRDAGDGPLPSGIEAYVNGLGARAVIGHPGGLIDWPGGAAARSAAARAGDTGPRGSGPNAAAGYPPLYYAAAAVAWHAVPGGSVPARLLAMRLMGVLLFGAVVALAWWLTATVLAAWWARVAAAGLVALQPKLGFTAAVVNPDILLIALSSAFLVSAALTVCRGTSRWRWLAMVVTVIAACLTHPRGYYLIVPLAFTAWFTAHRAARERGDRRLLAAANAAGVAGLLALAAGIAVLTARWGNGTGVRDVREFASYLWQFYLPRLDFLRPIGPAYGYRQVYIETFFSTFGQLDTSPSIRFVDLAQAGVFICLVALFTTVVARWNTVRAGWPTVWLLASTVLSLLLLLHLVAFRELQGGTDPIITGRYLLCAVLVYGVAAAWVFSSLPRRAGPVVAAPLLMISAMMTIGGIGLTALRFYG